MITPRQREVLHWMAEGKYPDEIATILRITRRTVYFHLERARENLNCVSSSQAIALHIKMRKRRKHVVPNPTVNCAYS